MTVTLERGGDGVEHEMMEVEWLPPTQDVLDAVSSLRSGNAGYAPMQLDLPRELDGGSPPSGGPIVVVGASSSPSSPATALGVQYS